MKKLFTLMLMVLLTITILAQAPSKMSYQFVIRNTSGSLVVNSPVGVRISILQGSPAGALVYRELFNPNPQTNANGLVSIEIGTGLPITGTFSSINWAGGPYYLLTETDPSGGTSYTVTGTSQLLSVPYSLYSAMSASVSDNSITSAKIANGTIIAADLADGSVTSAKIADGTIATSDIANNAVTGAKIADETITAADIQNRQRNIVFPANALNYDKGSSILTQDAYGIYWKSNFADGAYLTIPRPLDWVGTSNVILKLHFMKGGATGGVVNFFIRPRSYNPGDSYADAPAQFPDSPVTVAAGTDHRIYTQTFTIPYSKFGTKNLWVISIQRKGSGETFTGDLILMAVEIVYMAEQ